MNKKNICRNCKYFRFQTDYFKDTDKEKMVEKGICLNVKVRSDFVHDWEKREDRTDDIDGVYATCDEQRGELFVGIEFGCIHFEQV